MYIIYELIYLLTIWQQILLKFIVFFINIQRFLPKQAQFFNLFPTDHIPPIVNVARSFILVFKVIGMFPDVKYEKREHILGHWTILLQKEGNLSIQPNTLHNLVLSLNNIKILFLILY